VAPELRPRRVEQLESSLHEADQRGRQESLRRHEIGLRMFMRTVSNMPEDVLQLGLQPAFLFAFYSLAPLLSVAVAVVTVRRAPPDQRKVIGLAYIDRFETRLTHAMTPLTGPMAPSTNSLRMVEFHTSLTAAAPAKAERLTVLC
jgi:hypothetical protein